MDARTKQACLKPYSRICCFNKRRQKGFLSLSLLAIQEQMTA